jgi:nucleoporin POM152
MPAPPPQSDSNASMVPFTVLDAPSQRLYAIAFYAALMVWRTYDWWNLYMENADSLWLFMKWIAIDGVFLYGLPALRIPWIEWSSSTTTLLFLVHAIFDAFLMFLIPV